MCTPPRHATCTHNACTRHTQCTHNTGTHRHTHRHTQLSHTLRQKPSFRCARLSGSLPPFRSAVFSALLTTARRSVCIALRHTLHLSHDSSFSFSSRSSLLLCNELLSASPSGSPFVSTLFPPLVPLSPSPTVHVWQPTPRPYCIAHYALDFCGPL